MALMLFHAARLEARLDDRGFILLMEDQDRSKWDRGLVRRAQQFLDLSAEGTTISAYHLEAGIAFHHSTASGHGETDWLAILSLYDKLISVHRSPVYLLNRAIVVAEIEGPLAGIRKVLEEESSFARDLRQNSPFAGVLNEAERRKIVAEVY